MRYYILAVLLLLAAAPMISKAQTQDSTEKIVAAARQAAQQDRHAQAAALFRQAIQKDPKDIDARLDYAQFLWDEDDLRGAAAQYEAVLHQDPINDDALRNYARLQSWRDRYRESKQLTLAYLQQHPGDRESRITLAQDELWMDRPYEAQAQVLALMQSNSNDSEVLALRSRVSQAVAPSVEASYESATQSDSLNIQDARLAINYSPDEGRTTLSPMFERFRYNSNIDGSEIIVAQPGFGVTHRFTDWMELNAQYNSGRITVPADDTLDRTIGTYNVNMSLWAGDSVKLVVGTEKHTFDNLLSLAEGISANSNSISAEVQPDELLHGTVWYAHEVYSDGNREDLLQLALDRQVLRSPRLTVGVDATQAHFSEMLNNGYFNPQSYHGIEATLASQSSLGPRLDYDIDLGLGTASQHPGGNETAYSMEGSLSYRVSRQTFFEIYYNAYNTYAASNNGFARHELGAVLRQKM